MNNLLKSDFYKIFHARSVYVCLIITAIIAFSGVLMNVLSMALVEKYGEDALSGKSASTEYNAGYNFGYESAMAFSEFTNPQRTEALADVSETPPVTVANVMKYDFSSVATPTFYFTAIIIGMLMSNEFAGGSLRNVIARGTPRRKVYLSKLISFSAVSVLLGLFFMLFELIATLIFGSMGTFSLQWLAETFAIFLYGVLFHIAMTSVFVTVSFLMRNNGSIPINLCILMFGGIIFAVLGYITTLDITPYWIINAQSNDLFIDYLTDLPVNYGDNILAAVCYTAVFTAIGILSAEKSDIR